MPIYCYKTNDGEVVEREFRMGEAPAQIWADGKVAKRDYRAERVKVPPTAGWPMEPCCASGVQVSQSDELRKYLGNRGCPTEVVDGDPVYRDKNHRDRALKIRGLVDRN